MPGLNPGSGLPSGYQVVRFSISASEWSRTDWPSPSKRRLPDGVDVPCGNAGGQGLRTGFTHQTCLSLTTWAALRSRLLRWRCSPALPSSSEGWSTSARGTFSKL